MGKRDCDLQKIHIGETQGFFYIINKREMKSYLTTATRVETAGWERPPASTNDHWSSEKTEASTQECEHTQKALLVDLK